MPQNDRHKPALPTTIPPTRDTPPDTQDALRERHKIRGDVREAVKQLSAALKDWVHDIILDPDRFRDFYADGHSGAYQELPEGTLARKLHELGWTEAEIMELNTVKTPLDLMALEELRYVLQRIHLMLTWFRDHSQGGNFQHACAIYEAVGQMVRRQVMQQTGHAPEDFPAPGVIITGVKEEARRLKPTPYRATLFPPDPAEEQKL